MIHPLRSIYGDAIATLLGDRISAHADCMVSFFGIEPVYNDGGV